MDYISLFVSLTAPPFEASFVRAGISKSTCSFLSVVLIKSKVFVSVKSLLHLTVYFHSSFGRMYINLSIFVSIYVWNLDGFSGEHVQKLATIYASTCMARIMIL